MPIAAPKTWVPNRTTTPPEKVAALSCCCRAKLEWMLTETGFEDIRFHDFNQGHCPDLIELEHEWDPPLVRVEARRAYSEANAGAAPGFAEFADLGFVGVAVSRGVDDCKPSALSPENSGGGPLLDDEQPYAALE